MYPLNMKNESLGGYAVANDLQEHKALSAQGYEPALVEPKTDEDGTTGVDLPEQSPAEQIKRGPGRPKKTQ